MALALQAVISSSRCLSSASASCSSRVESRSFKVPSGSSFLGAPKPALARVHSRRPHAGGMFNVMAVNDGGRRDVRGDQTSKQVLDAFFLGRAFAETINERLGSALGEFISEISRIQAEQREMVRQFQEEVQSRAEAELSKAAKSAAYEPPPPPPATFTAAGTVEEPPSTVVVSTTITPPDSTSKRPTGKSSTDVPPTL